MNRSGVSNSSANSHQWKCPARYRTSVRAKILAPSRCSSQRGFVSMWHKLLRYLERKNHQFFFARPARDNLRFGKRRLRIKIRAAARIINQCGGDYGNHKRKQKAERYDSSRPKNNSERQDSRRALRHFAQRSAHFSNRASRRRRRNLRAVEKPGAGPARSRL